MHYLRALGGVIGVLMLVGCTTQPNQLALIHYKQLGACINAQTGSGSISAPPSHAVVVFRVSSIDNTKPSVDWIFDSTSFTINPPSAPQQNLGGTGPIPIAHNQNVPLNTLVGILVETSESDGTDASGTNYFLVYPTVPPAPGNVSVKDNHSQLSYPFTPDCNAISGG